METTEQTTKGYYYSIATTKLQQAVRFLNEQGIDADADLVVMFFCDSPIEDTFGRLSKEWQRELDRATAWELACWFADEAEGKTLK